MPSRNVLKVDVQQSYYHVFARGRGRQPIFRDEEDYNVFFDLLKRHLSIDEVADKYGKPYPHLRGQIELLAYCLMPNHFHLLLYQEELGAMSKLMRGIMTSYSTYFNKKYQTSGGLFESRYKATLISREHLKNVSRYVHLKPVDWRAYPYSSISSYFIGQPEWLQNDRIIDLFGTLPIYADFLDDTEDYEESLDDIRDELADR